MIKKFVEVPFTFTLQEVLRGHQTGLSNEELGMLMRSKHVPVWHHRAELRATGDPYHEHCLAVAEIVRRIDGGIIEQVAASLHDEWERPDGEAVKKIKKEMRIFFPKRVFFLVAALTKPKNEDQYFRQLYRANCKDSWVLIIKMADRLHNLRTIRGFGIKRRRQYLEETLGIFLETCLRGREWVFGHDSKLLEIYDGLIKQIQVNAKSELAKIKRKL